MIMYTVRVLPYILTFLLLGAVTTNNSYAQRIGYKVTIDGTMNGSVSVDPALPADSTYNAGTIVTVTVTPDEGYSIDSGYYTSPGPFGFSYHETRESTFDVLIDQDRHIGASFIESSKLEGFSVTSNVVYAQPGVKKLKYDVYSPDNAENLPIIIIVHGGGWRANNEDIMRGLARELVRSGDYVVFSIDYRWAGTADGDDTPNTMANLIEDVFGAVAHIQEHAEQYGGDPTRIALTGDSAGGHLSAAAADMPDMIGDGGFGETPGLFEFMPTYMPENKTVTQVRKEITDAIKAAAPSYGIFADLNTYSDDPDADSTWSMAVSPINYIPDANVRTVPQFLGRGMEDRLISNEMVQSYADSLEAVGQHATYVQIAGIGHAYLDWKPNPRVKATFAEYGVPYAAQMKTFFDSIFYQ